MQERLQACDLLLRMIRGIKVSIDWLRCVFRLSSLFTSRWCSQNRSPSGLRFAKLKLFAKSASYAVHDIGWGKEVMINDLEGSFASRYFRSVANERNMFCLVTVPI